VVANLNASAFVVMAGDIARVLKPNGRAVLSGFTQAQADRVIHQIPLVVLETQIEGEWCAVSVRKAC